MRPYVEELSKLTPYNTCIYPNAGLPNAFGAYDEGPDSMGAYLQEFIENGWVNIIGGCCGTTPDHIRKFVEIAGLGKPRKIKGKRQKAKVVASSSPHHLITSSPHYSITALQFKEILTTFCITLIYNT